MYGVTVGKIHFTNESPVVRSALAPGLCAMLIVPLEGG